MPQHRTFTQLVIFSLLLTDASSVLASPIINEVVKRYPISGSDADELRADMNAVGPEIGGGRYNASTAYFVKWNSQYDMTEEGCKIANERVTLSTTYTYPAWQDYSTAAPAMQADWNKFINMLKQHEHGHQQHGIDAANAVEAMLRSLPAMENCKALEEIAVEKTNAIIAEYKIIDANYDILTHHGANQVYAQN